MKISLEELLLKLDTPPETVMQESLIWKRVEEESEIGAGECMVALDEYYQMIGLSQFGGEYKVPRALGNVAKLRLNAFEQGLRDEMRNEMGEMSVFYKVRHGCRRVSAWMHNIVSKDKIYLKSADESYRIEVKDKWEQWMGDGMKFMLAEGLIRFYRMWKDINCEEGSKAKDYLQNNLGNYEGLFAKYCEVV